MKRIQKLTGLLLILFAVVLTSISCNKNNTYISKKKLKAKVMGTWYLQPTFNFDNDEVWVFDADKVTRLDPAGNEIDHGFYEVVPRINSSKINITGMINETYNGKWYIVIITGNTLQMTVDYKCEGGEKHCGIFQRDLYR